jgi:RimJ/RimL family protein N-acetyltransferase
MKLIPVYDRLDRHELLYRLLAERSDEVNISHKAMPGWCQHVAFVESKPYEAWYFIVDDEVHGACYLTKGDEIGIHIYRDSRGGGRGPKAVKALIREHGPRRYLANVNPRNEPSAAMFARLGFTLIQHTYELNEPAPSHKGL